MTSILGILSLALSCATGWYLISVIDQGLAFGNRDDSSTRFDRFCAEPSQHSVDYICDDLWHAVADTRTETHVEGPWAQMGVRLNRVVANCPCLVFGCTHGVNGTGDTKPGNDEQYDNGNDDDRTQAAPPRGLAVARQRAR
jgi:hypothetical protein